MQALSVYVCAAAPRCSCALRACLCASALALRPRQWRARQRNPCSALRHETARAQCDHGSGVKGTSETQSAQRLISRDGREVRKRVERKQCSMTHGLCGAEKPPGTSVAARCQQQAHQATQCIDSSSACKTTSKTGARVRETCNDMSLQGLMVCRTACVSLYRSTYKEYTLVLASCWFLKWFRSERAARQPGSLAAWQPGSLAAWQSGGTQDGADAACDRPSPLSARGLA